VVDADQFQSARRLCVGRIAGRVWQKSRRLIAPLSYFLTRSAMKRSMLGSSLVERASMLRLLREGGNVVIFNHTREGAKALT
jgi:hypothetical protein